VTIHCLQFYCLHCLSPNNFTQQSFKVTLNSLHSCKEPDLSPTPKPKHWILHIFCADNLWAGQSGDRILVGARFSAPVQTSPEAHPASCTMGTGSFPGVRCGWGVTLTPHTFLVPRSKIEYSYTSTLPKGLRGLWQGETYLHFLCNYVTYIFNTNSEHNIFD
jgi:hypothetical protein